MFIALAGHNCRYFFVYSTIPFCALITQSISLSLLVSIAKTGLSGSVDGKIYFMFTQSSTTLIEKNVGKTEGDVPAGDYDAVVRVLLEAKI